MSLLLSVLPLNVVTECGEDMKYMKGTISTKQLTYGEGFGCSAEQKQTKYTILQGAWQNTNVNNLSHKFKINNISIILSV